MDVVVQAFHLWVPGWLGLHSENLSPNKRKPHSNNPPPNSLAFSLIFFSLSHTSQSCVLFVILVAAFKSVLFSSISNTLLNCLPEPHSALLGWTKFSCVSFKAHAFPSSFQRCFSLRSILKLQFQLWILHWGQVVVSPSSSFWLLSSRSVLKVHVYLNASPST